MTTAAVSFGGRCSTRRSRRSPGATTPTGRRRMRGCTPPRLAAAATTAARWRCGSSRGCRRRARTPPCAPVCTPRVGRRRRHRYSCHATRRLHRGGQSSNGRLGRPLWASSSGTERWLITATHATASKSRAKTTLNCDWRSGAALSPLVSRDSAVVVELCERAGLDVHALRFLVMVA